MRYGLAGKIYSAVVALAVMAIVIGGMGAGNLYSYKKIVDNMGRASHEAVMGERVNGLILAIVMDSRGIYMSRTPAESEKFAAPLLKNLERLRSGLMEWHDLAPTEQLNAVEEAQSAANEVRDANAKIGGLATAAQKIGEVVSLIKAFCA